MNANGHHRTDQAGYPRERLLQYGAHTLTDAELVSLLLSAGANTVQLAQRLLETVGGVPGLARWHPEALRQLPGLGEITAARLVAALALPQRRNTMNTVTVTGPADLAPVFRPLLGGLLHERLAVAVCDRRNRVRAVRAVADGQTGGCPAPVRDILATVLRHDGHAFAIGHNHPSGDPTPSTLDQNTTMHCGTAANTIGLKFLGHLVLGEHDSWAQA